MQPFDPVWLAVPVGEPEGGERWARLAEGLRAALAAGDLGTVRSQAEAALEDAGAAGREADCLRWIARLARQAPAGEVLHQQGEPCPRGPAWRGV